MIAKRRVLFSKFLVILFLLLLFTSTVAAQDEIKKPQPKNKETFSKIRFRKMTEERFRHLFTPSFAIAVTSFNSKAGTKPYRAMRDDLDDVIIGRHAEAHPMILINKGSKFIELKNAIPKSVKGDLHGVYAGDINQDGFRDLLIAGGGGEGITSGRDNVILINTGSDKEDTSFTDESASMDLGSSQARARHLIPFVDGVDNKVKYYLITKPLKGFTNTVFATDDHNAMYELADHSLKGAYNCEARGDSFVDIDGDFDLDAVINHDDNVRIFRNDEGVYTELKPNETKIISSTLNFKNLSQIGRVMTVKWGDINNDGLMDVYLGRRKDRIRSDQFASGEEDGRNVIQFCFIRQGAQDKYDEITFKLKDSKININFVRRPGIGTSDPSDIFIGENNINPEARKGLIEAKDALGHKYLKPGIYIYHTGISEGYYTWHLRWYSSPEVKNQLGRIYLNGVPEMGSNGIEVWDIPSTTDLIFINMGFRKGQLQLQSVETDLTHKHLSRDAVWIDLNNDGLLDLAGIRGNYRGAENGDPFVLVNEGINNKKMPSFWNQPTTFLTADEAFLSQADGIAVGFFNEDGLPDAVVTNGWGLNPGNRGPIEFFYNTTETRNKWAVVVLKGKAPNTEAIGAHVRLQNKAGEYISGIRQVGGSYNRMQSTNKLHFGLGSDRRALQAEIIWPDGTREIRVIRKNRINYFSQK